MWRGLFLLSLWVLILLVFEFSGGSLVTFWEPLEYALVAGLYLVPYTFAPRFGITGEERNLWARTICLQLGCTLPFALGAMHMISLNGLPIESISRLIGSNLVGPMFSLLIYNVTRPRPRNCPNHAATK